jgi:hypothetical protein
LPACNANGVTDHASKTIVGLLNLAEKASNRPLSEFQKERQMNYDVRVLNTTSGAPGALSMLVSPLVGELDGKGFDLVSVTPINGQGGTIQLVLIFKKRQ